MKASSSAGMVCRPAGSAHGAQVAGSSNPKLSGLTRRLAESQRRHRRDPLLRRWACGGSGQCRSTPPAAGVEQAS